MASFPNSVKAFASRSAGQVIASAHVNDLQDEVNAIETWAINGPVSLPASTIANLSVTGGSTMGTLNVTGGSTFAGVTFGSTVNFGSSVTFSSGVTLNGAVTFGSSGTFTMPRGFACRLSHSAGQNVNNATFTGLNWDTETYDPSNLHSTSVNSSRITFGSTGVWMVGASAEWSNASSVGVRSLRVDLNDATHLAGTVAQGSGAGDAASVATSLLVTATTDYVTAVVFQNSGSTNSITGPASNYVSAFWAYKVTG